jgi:hypothetical protein
VAEDHGVDAAQLFGHQLVDLVVDHIGPVQVAVRACRVAVEADLGGQEDFGHTCADRPTGEN